MEKQLFVYPDEIPKHIPSVPMYRTTKYRTLSRRTEGVQKDLDAKIKRYSTLFNMDVEPTDLGDRLFLENDDYELEIYRASDSLLYCHKQLRYREEVLKEGELPTENNAIEMAKKYLDSLEMDVSYASTTYFDYTKVSRYKIGEKDPKPKKTEAHVMYSFSIDGHPVFGPGAKIKVSLVENDVISGLLYFWRNPVKDIDMPIIHPDKALERLVADRGFRNLKPETAEVTFHTIQLGYYSLTPTEFQRFMIPVYAITGTVVTEFFEEYRFTRYVVAVDLSFEDIKRHGVVANPYHCGII